MKKIQFERTKIVATVGPASESYEAIEELIRAGVDCFRLNFSHGSYESFERIIQHIQQANRKLHTHVGIIADLQGPKLRIGELPPEGIEVHTGEEIIFTTKPGHRSRDKVTIDYPSFAADVRPGERILVDDGKLIFEVVETNQRDEVRLKTLFGGTLGSHKGVNLPHTDISLPCLTEKDLRDLDFILQQTVHWIALSFVRKPEDIVQLRQIIDQRGHFAKIIAKIEKPEAVENIDAIIQVSDAVMIARGDLAIEMPMERLPALQKHIIQKSIRASRPVIVATQLMESMITNPSPTRAEITDVANAVMDGADALMLSGETSIGRHPVKVVDMVTKIIMESEKLIDWQKYKPDTLPLTDTFASDVICLNAVKTAETVDATAIVGMTVSGYTAFKISSFRPKTPVFIFSANRYILDTLNLVWGVSCYYYDKMESTDSSIADTLDILKTHGHIRPGDYVINTGTMPLHKKGRTNFLKISLVE